MGGRGNVRRPARAVRTRAARLCPCWWKRCAAQGLGATAGGGERGASGRCRMSDHLPAAGSQQRDIEAALGGGGGGGGADSEADAEADARAAQQRRAAAKALVEQSYARARAKRESRPRREQNALLFWAMLTLAIVGGGTMLRVAWTSYHLLCFSRDDC